jgi:hypothetical protein
MARGPLTSTSRPTLPHSLKPVQRHSLIPSALQSSASPLSLLSRPQGLHLRRRRHSGEDARPCSLVPEPDGPFACSWRGGRAWRRISEVRTQRSVAPPRPRRSGGQAGGSPSPAPSRRPWISTAGALEPPSVLPPTTTAGALERDFERPPGGLEGDRAWCSAISGDRTDRPENFGLSGFGSCNFCRNFGSHFLKPEIFKNRLDRTEKPK